MNPGPAGLKELSDLFSRIITISVSLAFVALFVMLIVSGIKLMLAGGGDPKNLQSAKQAATWSIAGMGFLVLAWLVLRLISAFTGVDVTHVCFSLAGC